MGTNEKNIWVIGDIHGCFDPLKNILTLISTYENNKLIFLGDYVDFGPSSKEILDYLMQLQCEKVFLMGNHEQMMLDYIKRGNIYQKYRNTWVADNGGYATIKSFFPEVRATEHNFGNITPDVFPLEKKYVEFLESLQLTHTEEISGYKFLFAHACLNEHKSINQKLTIEEQLTVKNIAELESICEKKELFPEQNFLWHRKSLETKYKDFILVHGHTPTFKLDRVYDDLQGYDVQSGYPFFKFVMPHKKKQEYIYLYRAGRRSDRYHIPIEHYIPFDQLISIYLDTGAIQGGYLTALRLSEKSVAKRNFEAIQIGNGSNYREERVNHSLKIEIKK